jgi:hypothetical protein
MGTNEHEDMSQEPGRPARDNPPPHGKPEAFVPPSSVGQAASSSPPGGALEDSSSSCRPAEAETAGSAEQAVRPVEDGGQSPAQSESVCAASAAGEESATLVGLAAQFQELRQGLGVLQPRLEAIQDAIAGTSKQISFLPRQVSMVADKVDAVTSSISDARCRSLLSDLLRIYELADQVLRGSDPQDGREARNCLEILCTQLGQILTMNGLSQICAEGLFDPKIHRAVLRIPCRDPSRANQISRLVRPGFCIGNRILRYAEVEVLYYEGSEPPSQQPGQAEASEPADTETTRQDSVPPGEACKRDSQE